MISKKVLGTTQLSWRLYSDTTMQGIHYNRTSGGDRFKQIHIHQWIPDDIPLFLSEYGRVEPYQPGKDYDADYVDESNYRWIATLQRFRRRDDEINSDRTAIAFEEIAWVAYGIDLTKEQRVDLEPFCRCYTHRDFYARCMRGAFPNQKIIISCILAKASGVRTGGVITYDRHPELVHRLAQFLDFLTLNNMRGTCSAVRRETRKLFMVHLFDYVVRRGRPTVKYPDEPILLLILAPHCIRVRQAIADRLYSASHTPRISLRARVTFSKLDSRLYEEGDYEMECQHSNCCARLHDTDAIGDVLDGTPSTKTIA